MVVLSIKHFAFILNLDFESPPKYLNLSNEALLAEMRILIDGFTLEVFGLVLEVDHRWAQFDFLIFWS